MQQTTPEARRHRRGVAAKLSSRLLAVMVVVAPVYNAGVAGSAWAQSQSELAAEVSELRKRVEQLEGQLVDLQVIIGTLESLARSSGSAAPVSGQSFSGGGEDSARVAALETQVSALAAQIERLSGGGGAASDTTTFSPQSSEAVPGFGSTTINTDPGAGSGEETFGSSFGLPGSEPVASSDLTASLAAPSASLGDPKQDYERAYGYLLQQKYDEAQAGFEGFLAAHPRHELAGNAQYWLGEVHFVRGDFKAAAQAFLDGYQNHGRSSKAADSLLKLAVSLDRLGQSRAACDSFSELLTRFPNAATYITERATQERQRIGC